jgi:membrane-bound serine protease (ClpP class)
MNGQETSGTLLASIILGVAALAIFLLELVLPTGGLLAILCVASAIGSIVLGFMYHPTLGMALLALYAAAAPFLFVFGLRIATKSRLGRRMVLTAEDPARTGAGIAEPGADLPAIGATGEAITPLRPAGFVRIGGRRLDATAEGNLIDAGTPIEVVSVRDAQVRVRPRRG